MEKERRSAPRARVKLAARWEGVLSREKATVTDLSRSGCLIQWYHEQTPGCRFTLEVELPEAGWLRLEAEPVYNRTDYGFAVKFVDVPPETMATLDKAIDLLRSRGRSAL